MTSDRVTQAVRLCDASGSVGECGAGVHGTAPASITDVHCAAAVITAAISAHQYHLSQRQIISL